MSDTRKVHRKDKYRDVKLKYSIMMCGMEIPLADTNYLNRVTNISRKVMCGNCKRIQ